MALTFSPDGIVREDGRTLAEIIADEEYLESEVPRKEKKEEKKMKFMSFELDMTYPRTLRGFMRLIQIFLLVVGFVCLIISSELHLSGAYTFYCVALVFGALISGFLFFTLIAGTRKHGLCGMSWIKVELLYFVLFGFLIFIGACLVASNSSGNAALNAGAAFGFLATITFVCYVFWSWKDYKNPPEDPNDKENEENEENKDDVESQHNSEPGNGNGGKGEQFAQNNSMERRRTGSMIDPPENRNGDLRIDAPVNKRNNNGHPAEYRSLNNRTRSLERPLSVISRNELIDPHIRKGQHRRSVHRRQHSGSDKDSAYSEGSIIEKDRSLPTKIRRTTSALAEDRRRHSERGRKRNHFDDRRQLERSSGRRPLQLSPEMLNQEERPRKSVPQWLRAALECDNESELGTRRVSTMPAPRRNEFPLLHMSDEESIAYPSVSQNFGDGNFGPHTIHTMPGEGQRDARQAHRGRRMVQNQRPRHHGQHVHNGRGGKRFLQHGGRHSGGHGRRHGHGGHRGYHGGRRGGRHGRIHHGQRGGQGAVHDRRPQNEEMLRRMVENDKLVNRNIAGPESMPAANLAFHKRNENENRRMFPEQPSSIHFPEKSRWDDNDLSSPGEFGGHNMVEKYLKGQG